MAGSRNNKNKAIYAMYFLSTIAIYFIRANIEVFI